MEFIETSVFTRQITGLLSDAEYDQLQRLLLLWPLAGDLIKHSGGLRKLRHKAKGRGKRGGIRVIYYYLTEDQKIFLLYAYAKGRKDDLNTKELKILREIVKEELS